MRIKATVEYDGTAYGGWQLQKNAPSIQGELERVLMELCGRRIAVTAAGRTDAGVHALAMPVHFDLESSIPPEKLPFVFNRNLPPDIRMISAEQKEGFHARFDAKGKTYRYAVCNRPHASAMERNRSMHFPYKLELEPMQEAAKFIEGRHDFAAFAASGAQTKTTVRTVKEVKVEKCGDMFYITVTGDGFLYNMVRIIAGTLLSVGNGRMTPEQVRLAVESGNREDAGFTAEPQGLTLLEVYYD
ncbi:MAG: tRNA pseudouridine(38-40) synthase TruA [Clostridia bacterium]|nr:tRNA pseudouridine(38-40) synthase TruA [Clostridia bacterium]